MRIDENLDKVELKLIKGRCNWLEFLSTYYNLKGVVNRILNDHDRIFIYSHQNGPVILAIY